METTLEKTVQPLPECLAKIARQYAAESEEALRAALKKHMAGTVEHLCHMACIIRRLDELGADLSDIWSPQFEDLRRLAYGQMLPDAYIKVFDNRSLLNEVRMMTLPDQERIARDEPLPVVVQRENGPETRLVPVSRIDKWQLRQVFCHGRIRNETEQVNFLDRPRNHSKPNGPNIIIEKKHSRIRIVGECYLMAADLANYLQRLTEK